jgi:hypothetical protein
MVDTNQLKNTMAALSPNGRFLAAAAFTADVKVWNGSVHSLPSVWVLFPVILLPWRPLNYVLYPSDNKVCSTADMGGRLWQGQSSQRSC